MKLPVLVTIVDDTGLAAHVFEVTNSWDIEKILTYVRSGDKLELKQINTAERAADEHPGIDEVAAKALVTE